MGSPDSPTWVVLGRSDAGVVAVRLDAAGAETSRETVAEADLTGWVAGVESTTAPRWVWHDTPQWYPELLAAGVRVARCHDLRLCHAILRDSVFVDASAAVRDAAQWDAAPHVDQGRTLGDANAFGRPGRRPQNTK